jgi:hypothetical protein
MGLSIRHYVGGNCISGFLIRIALTLFSKPAAPENQSPKVKNCSPMTAGFSRDILQTDTEHTKFGDVVTFANSAGALLLPTYFHACYTLKKPSSG